MPLEKYSSYPVMGIDLHDVGYSDALTIIDDTIADKKQGIIATVNNEIVLWARKNPQMFAVLKKTIANVADSMGILLALRLFGFRLKQGRVIGVELVKKIALASSYRNYKIFLLGGDKNNSVAKKAAIYLKNNYEGVVVGYDSGPILDNNGEVIDTYNYQELAEKIKESKANILLVAFGGGPKQELWLHKNISRFPDVAVGIGVGGTFDYLSGIVRETPKTIRSIGLEWLWRLMTQNNRTKRVFNATFVFVSKIVLWRLRSFFLYRQGVVAIIANSENKILICKQTRPPFHWQLVQGGIEKNETKEEAVLREIFEETRIEKKVLRIEQINQTPYTYDFGPYGCARYGFRGQSKNNILLRCDKNVKISLDTNVFSQYVWVSRDEAMKLLHPSRSEEINSIKYFSEYLD